jgi:hypothetical protein
MADQKPPADPTRLTTQGDIPPRFRYEDWDGPDVAKSFGSGLISGFGQLFGLPGDARRAINGLHDQYVRPIEQRLGFQGPAPEVLEAIDAQRPSLLPTSQKISKLAAALLGQPHQPQTDYGNAAYTVCEKLPAVPLYVLMRGP